VADFSIPFPSPVPPGVPPGFPPFPPPVPPEEWLDLRRRHLDLIGKIRLPYYFGCRLKVLVVADNFLYFNDENFGLSELVATLRGMSTFMYPVTVDLAHRRNPGAARLAGATPNYTFSYDHLKQYHQVWLFAADYPSSAISRNQPVPPPISDNERRALRRFMDEGGGVFATGDHEDLGVTVGGYIPRVRSMRQWFFPGAGPQGESVAPHGSNATRHDTNRAGQDGMFSFNDQSDDVPQTITPHFFGGFVQTAHPLLCTPSGPIRVLPDHAHEGRCVLPANLAGNYSIGSDSFREYPDGPDGNPVAPVIAATATMIAGAAAPEFGKPPVPGGSFGVIGAWDGNRAGVFGRVVVDATWHHFINVNLIGDRDLGPPTAAIPKTLGFLHTAAGQAHYERIKAYFRNIANWMTPRSVRRCRLHRHLWWLARDGVLQESLRADDLTVAGRIAFDRLRWLGPCDRLSIFDDLALELKPDLRRLIDPWAPEKGGGTKLAGLQARDAQQLADDLVANVLGGAVLEIARLDLDPAELLAEAGGKGKANTDENFEVKALSNAVDAGARAGVHELATRLKARAAALRGVSALLG
jgi:hypothetical protein